mmetsp:Transcript_93981/g.166343  ORF Transcript_93981/g.166343 Transcript_93981/m.166343 type:complete len:701 (-) Transcript_93981:20-2122(-)
MRNIALILAYLTCAGCGSRSRSRSRSNAAKEPKMQTVEVTPGLQSSMAGKPTGEETSATGSLNSLRGLANLLLACHPETAFNSLHPAPFTLGSCRKNRPFVMMAKTAEAHLAASPEGAAESLTQQLMRSLPEEEQSLGSGGQTTYDGLVGLDKAWHALRNGQLKPARKIVTEEPEGPQETPDFDVVVCGGTIGILLAAALQLRGLSVAVVEAGKLRGRTQDWNASRKEVMELVELGILTMDDLKEVIANEWNPVRVGFTGGTDVWLQDVLNTGVRPRALIAAARRTFEAKGGRVFEDAPLDGVAVRPGAALLTLGGGKAPIRARLVLDSMGQRSPIVAQIRDGQLPDSACVVVGSCANGYPEEMNTYGDVLYLDTPTMCAGSDGCPTQYFWEAFPASSGPRDRTTYLFAYMDLAPERPSILEIMEDYWKLLPSYQGVQVKDLELRRVAYGLFVSYKNSPLPSHYDRVLQVGDASGIQSPLSFGGFGAITRHIGRLTNAIKSALDADALSSNSLSLINPYQPNLRAAWLFQDTMRPPVQSMRSNMFISHVLGAAFDAQEAAGEDVQKAFLQDVLRVDGLVATLGGMIVRNPRLIPQILGNLGAGPIADWVVHFITMIIYSGLNAGYHGSSMQDHISKLPPRFAYELERRAESWQFGAGLDYTHEPSPPVPPELLARAKAGVAASQRAAAELKLAEPAAVAA